MPDEYQNQMEELRSISIGASFHTLGFCFQKLLRFTTQVILTRGLGPSLYGFYAYGMSLVILFRIIARLGTGKSLLKLIPEHKDSKSSQSWILGLSYLTALCGSLLIGVGLFFAAPLLSSYTLKKPVFVDILQVFGIYLPFRTLSDVTIQIFRSYEQPRYQITVEKILDPGLRLLFIAFALLLGYGITGAAYATLLAGIGVALIGIASFYYRERLVPRLPSNREDITRFYKLSIPLTFKDLGQVLYTRVDIFMVGFLLVSSSVGIYRVAVALSSLLAFPLAAFNQLFPPIASRLYSSGRVDKLEQLYTDVTSIIYTLSVLPTILLIIFAPELLSVFGTKFVEGQSVVTMLAVAQLLNAVVGPCAYVLLMTDHERMIMVNQWLLGVSNAVLNYYLIQQYGIVGAAMATTLTLAGINVIRVGELLYFEGFHPYSIRYWKPTFAGLVTLGSTYLLRFALSGYPLLIIGGVMGTIVFFVVLRSVGVSDDINTLRRIVR